MNSYDYCLLLRHAFIYVNAHITVNLLH